MKIVALIVSALVAPLSSTSSSEAAGISVIDAKVQGGKLIVTGKTPSASQIVTLDSRFTAKSNNSRLFSFSLSNYLPSDCIVDLKAGSATGVGVVANCGPMGVSPRGTWGRSVPYLRNDLVYFLGSTWRAKASNIGQRPDTHLATWERFAAKGDKGNQGVQGPPGADGAFANASIRTKTCNDSGGWIPAPNNEVHCMLSCDVGEILSASPFAVIFGRNNGNGVRVPASSEFYPSSPPNPLPANRWVTYISDHATVDPNKSDGLLSATVTVVCETPG